MKSYNCHHTTQRAFQTGSKSIIEMNAAYDMTFFWFGSMNWIVRDMNRESFLAWSTNRWHAFCVSYDRMKSHITLIKVSTYYLNSHTD